MFAFFAFDDGSLFAIENLIYKIIWMGNKFLYSIK